jgi:hypothetical protein
MKIEGVIWLGNVVDKLAVKHHVEIEEAEEVLSNRPKFRFVEKGERGARMFTWLQGGRTREGTSRYCSFTRSRTTR